METKERSEALKNMLSAIKKKADLEARQMAKLKAEGKSWTPSYRQHEENRELCQLVLEKYKGHGSSS